jgi:glycosyltransferase involved in cell wall biosynthesis/O-antigen/teichoic acid export membrane protein
MWNFSPSGAVSSVKMRQPTVRDVGKHGEVFDDWRRRNGRPPEAVHQTAKNPMRGIATQLRGGVRTLSERGIDGFLRETGVLVLALGVLNGSNYLFHVVVSRQLGPSDYGALAALLAILLVLSVPQGVLQTVVAQRAAALRAKGRAEDVVELTAATTRGVLPLVLAAGLASLLLAAPLFAIFLDVSLASASLLAPVVVLGTLGAIPLGVLQGAMRFGAFAVVVLSGVGVRLATGIGFVEAGLGVPGAMLASSVAAAVSLVVGFSLVGLRWGWLARAKGSLEPFRGGFRVALFALVGFWLLAQADIVLARHFLDPEEAGYYSSAGLLARALPFMAAAVAFVAFPRFVTARERGEDALHWLRTSLLATGALVLAALAILVPFRNLVVELTFGESFLPAASLMPLLCIAMGALALVGLLTYFHIAMGSRAHVIPIAGLGLEIVLVLLFHDSAEQVAAIVAAIAVAAAITQYAAARSLVRWHPPLEQLMASRGGVPLPLEAEPSVELSVVLPCHNEAGGLRQTLEGLVHELEPAGSYEIIVVSDGSTDDSVAIAEKFADAHVRVLHYPRPGGKGYALQVGLTEARGRYVAFVDADGDIGPEAIGPFLTIMKLYEPDIVLGSKRHPVSRVSYPPFRRLMSWSYHKLTRLLFRVNVRDTQTGLKLVRRDVLAAVLPRLYEKRFAFDLELLVVARSLGYSRVFEAPVRVDYKFSSQVRPSSVVRVALDTAAIFYRHYVLGSYRPEEPARSAAAAIAFTPELGAERRVSTPALTARATTNGHLRVLFLNWRDLANPEAGGAEVFTHEVAKRWVAAGHDVSLLTSGFKGARSTENHDGVNIRRLGRLRSGSFHLGLQRELSRLNGFDVVIDGINTIPSLSVMWRRRLPATVALVYQMGQDVWDCELPRPFAALGRWAEPKLLRPYRDVTTVAISRSTRDDLTALGFGDVHVVPPGRDEPPSLGGVERESRPTFLFAGRLASNKRPDHAVAAFRHIRSRLPEARLWIVGRGPLERELAHDAGPGVELLGYVSRDELYERMARAHCLLVPSVREGWGLVVIEANSVGTPAVAYDVAGLRDSVWNDVTGCLVPAGDPVELARAAIDLYADTERYSDMSRHAADWADQFSWNETARQLLDVVEASVRHPGPGNEQATAYWRNRAA